MEDERESYVYFSQADAQLEYFVGPKRCRDDLVYRLLLEPGVVIPDVFFLISRWVASDVSDPNGWLVAGMGDGSVVPAFRTEGCDFASICGEIREARIKGVRSDAGNTARILADNEGAKRLDWPSGLGVSYRSKLESYFLGGLPAEGTYSADEKRLWTQTEGLRNASFEFAYSASPGVAKHGIRRGDLLQGLAAQVGFSGDATNVPRLLQKAPSRERASYAATAQWINELYHVNQANSLDEATEDFAIRSSSFVHRAGGTSIIGKRVARERAHREVSLPPAEARSIVVPWPTISALERVGAKDVLAARRESAPNYWARLDAYRSDPSDERWSSLTRELAIYAKELCKMAKSKHTNTLHLDLTDAQTLSSGALNAIASYQLVPETTTKVVSTTASLLLSFAIVGVRRISPVRRRAIRVDPNGSIQIDSPSRMLGRR